MSHISDDPNDPFNRFCNQHEWIVAVPAYGKDYKTQAECLAAWRWNKDFFIVSIGPYMNRYMNRRDYLKHRGPNSTVELRFNRRTELLVITEE